MSQVAPWQPGNGSGDASREGKAASGVEQENGRRIPCPVCGFPIGAVRGSKEAICRNCGFKDGCC